MQMSRADSGPISAVASLLNEDLHCNSIRRATNCAQRFLSHLSSSSQVQRGPAVVRRKTDTARVSRAKVTVRHFLFLNLSTNSVAFVHECAEAFCGAESQ